MRKLLAALVLCSAPVAWAEAPTSAPAPAIASSVRQLSFRFQDPQRLSVVVPGQKDPVVYWYMVYAVENNTDRELDFYPEFQIVTDTLTVINSGTGVSPEAYQAVHRRANDPALVAPEKVAGRILIGKDRARHSVAIWKDFDPKAKSFTVYVSGLSGEVLRWKNPAFSADQPENARNPRHFVLRKTLAIPYDLPGSVGSRSVAVPRRHPDKQTWVMR